MKKVTLLIALCCVYPLSYGQNPFSLEASYIGDGYYNAMGGLKRGGGFMGMGNIKIAFDTEKAGWFRGGTLFLNGASIHGKSLSENYLGDLQVASNIDAGEHAYLHELWYRQMFASLSFTLGLQDLNAEFMASQGAGEFINSSFGVPPVIATGVPIPIFPLTGLGIMARWDIDEHWAVQGALFDGDQADFEHNPHNINWTICRKDGLLTMGEIHFDNRYKVGAYYHSANRNYGFYLFADQPVSERLGLFAQIAFAPKSKNDNNYSLGLGLNYAIADRHTAGIAASHAGLHNVSHKHETALELYYKYHLSDTIVLQPDIQYIINPSGGAIRLPDALVLFLRLYINF